MAACARKSSSEEMSVTDCSGPPASASVSAAAKPRLQWAVRRARVGVGWDAVRALRAVAAALPLLLPLLLLLLLLLLPLLLLLQSAAADTRTLQSASCASPPPRGG